MKNVFFVFILLTSAYTAPSHASTEQPPARPLSKETIEKYFNELKNLNESTIIIKNSIIDNCLDLDITIEDSLLNKNLKDYLNFKLIHAIKTLDFNNVALALKHQADPNHVLQIKNSDVQKAEDILNNDSNYDSYKITNIFDNDYTPLQCALELKNLNEEEEAIRRSIIIELLKYGANPFIQKQKEDFINSHIYKYNTYFGGDNLYNLFSLENVVNNPDLALFLVQAGQKYAKEEYFQEFRQDFQATSLQMSKKDMDILDPLIFTFLSNNDVYTKGNFLMTRLNIPQDYSFLKNTNLEILIYEYPLLKLFRRNYYFIENYPNFEKDLPNLIEFFIKAGMNVNYQDRSLNSILQAAIKEKCNSEIIIKLLKHGANPNLQNDKGKNSLITAVEFGNVDALQILLQYGVNPNSQNNQGQNPLIIAINHNNLKALPILLQYGADPNLQDNQGQNPLMAAINHDRLSAVPILLESGADPLIKNKDNQNALDVINNKIKEINNTPQKFILDIKSYPKIKNLFLAIEKKALQENLADELSHLIGKTFPERPQKNANNIFRARLAKML